ncbi:hypothetical protein U9517_21310, partial [Escherichia coli]
PVSGGPNDTSVGEISVKTGNNARNGGKNSLNRLIRCVCGKKIGPDPRNFNQRVSLGRNDLLIRTFPNALSTLSIGSSLILYSGPSSIALNPGVTPFFNAYAILFSHLAILLLSRDVRPLSDTFLFCPRSGLT